MFSLLMIVGFSAATGLPLNPIGTWMTQDKDALIRIVPCPGRATILCGYVHRLLDPSDAGAHDDHNPDPAKRIQPVLGLKILDGFHSGRAGWVDGQIYDPDEGRLHTGLQLRMDSNSRLIISRPATVLMLKAELGKQTWTRVSP